MMWLGSLFMRSRIARFAFIAMAILGGLKINNAVQRRKGGQEVKQQLLRITQERTQDGVKAYHEARRANDDRDVSAILDRLRSNGDDWERMRNLQ